MATVSVVIPCYNHGHFLRRAVDSVLEQTSSDWEALIVDDGSTDNTREVADQIRDPRVRYMFQDNRGLAAARNSGIRAATGQYLAFLDADDQWDCRFIATCLAVFREWESLTAVVTLAKYIDDSGNILPASGGIVLPKQEFQRRLLEGGFFPVHAVLVKADVVRSVGMFDETLTSLEDWDLWLRIVAAGGEMISIPEPLAFYRITAGSMSSDAARMHDNRMRVLAKQFGQPDNDPRTWMDEKRQAFSFAYRLAAIGYIAQREPDKGWHYLAQAAEIDPAILQSLDTFYEVSLGDQPRGYRGQTEMHDITDIGSALLVRLEALFVAASSQVNTIRRSAYGKANLALGMLADQAGEWAVARRYIFQAVRHDSSLISRALVCRCAKLLIGKRVASIVRMFSKKHFGLAGPLRHESK